QDHCPAGQDCMAGSCIGPAQMGADGGVIVNPTPDSGVVAPATCSADPQCSPPDAVCEGQQCVPGCGAVGSAIQCGAGPMCSPATAPPRTPSTGRCPPVPGPCQNAAACMPPMTVCEAGQCVPGCGQVGGLQCGATMICAASTGRCGPGTASCTTDATCGAPAMI